MGQFKYLGEADDYKFLVNLKGTAPFDRTQIFTDGEFIYKYSTRKESGKCYVEKQAIPKSLGDTNLS